MDKLQQLQQDIYILYTLNIILKKFGMNNEADYLYDRIEKKEKEREYILNDQLFYIKKIKFKIYENKRYKYLNLYTLNNMWLLGNKKQKDNFKTQFTMSEIEDIKQRQGINWDEFELVPVEEEDKINETI